MDRALSTFNVNESLEELLVLLNRVANQKKVSFERIFRRTFLLSAVILQGFNL